MQDVKGAIQRPRQRKMPKSSFSLRDGADLDALSDCPDVAVMPPLSPSPLPSSPSPSGRAIPAPSLQVLGRGLAVAPLPVPVFLVMMPLSCRTPALSLGSPPKSGWWEEGGRLGPGYPDVVKDSLTCSVLQGLLPVLGMWPGGILVVACQDPDGFLSFVEKPPEAPFPVIPTSLEFPADVTPCGLGTPWKIMAHGFLQQGSGSHTGTTQPQRQVGSVVLLSPAQIHPELLCWLRSGSGLQLRQAKEQSRLRHLVRS
ncbi:PREDICTED: uncharacterized protein LOC105580969 [Cercocebus atys]|uniref:uncharacterized protein LOC105580969 n=1 Tax=Cercocebus atys TaxID=9531 RepID=UPI0005F51680|nr:PREDICTED: uncharacterized protein LOC105580969 [Cercocebus atys]